MDGQQSRPHEAVSEAMSIDPAGAQISNDRGTKTNKAAAVSAPVSLSNLNFHQEDASMDSKSNFSIDKGTVSFL